MILRAPPIPNPPFARSYWAVPRIILAGFYPADRDSVVALNKLNALVDCGVTHSCCFARFCDKAGSVGMLLFYH